MKDKPLLSPDLRPRPKNLVIAIPPDQLIGQYRVHIFGWYDNKWIFLAWMYGAAQKYCGSYTKNTSKVPTPLVLPEVQY